MARGRMIDKVIVLSRKLNAISEGAENLYYRILVHADDYGRYYAEPKILKGQIYTLRKISIKKIAGRIEELFRIGLIKLYKDSDELYLEIVDFDKHQTFKTDREKKAEFKIPNGYLEPNGFQLIPNGSLSKDKLSKDKLSKEKAKKDNFESLFEEFWKGYPKKIAKEYAKEKFMILARKGLIPELIKATNGYLDFLKHRKIKDNFEQEPLNPATFLMKNRWRDYVDFKYRPPL